MPAPKKEAKAPPLKAFRLLAGAHVGPDYSADPEEVAHPNGSVTLQYPPRQYKAQVVGTARTPGDSNIVYSPSDLSAKFNKPNSQKFIALGDPPAEVLEKFKAASDGGNLDSRHSGIPGTARRHFLSVGFGNRTSGTSEIGPEKGLTSSDPKGLAGNSERDPRDLSLSQTEEPDQDLNDMTVADLKELAEEEGVELSGRPTKDELVAAIKKGRKGK